MGMKNICLSGHLINPLWGGVTIELGHLCWSTPLNPAFYELKVRWAYREDQITLISLTIDIVEKKPWVKWGCYFNELSCTMLWDSRCVRISSNILWATIICLFWF